MVTKNGDASKGKSRNEAIGSRFSVLTNMESDEEGNNNAKDSHAAKDINVVQKSTSNKEGNNKKTKEKKKPVSKAHHAKATKEDKGKSPLISVASQTNSVNVPLKSDVLGNDQQVHFKRMASNRVIDT